MSFFNRISDLVVTSPNQVRLDKTSALTDFPDDIAADLQKCYKSTHATIRLCASIFNALLTQRRTTFLFSRRVFEELLRRDPNQERKTLNGQFYKTFIAELLQNKVFIKHRDSSKPGETGDRKGAIFEIIDREIVKKVAELVGIEYLEEQRRVTIEFYDSFGKFKKILDVEIEEKSHQKSHVPVSANVNEKTNSLVLAVSSSEISEETPRGGGEGSKVLANTSYTGEVSGKSSGAKNDVTQLEAIQTYYTSLKFQELPATLRSQLTRCYEVIVHPDSSEAAQAFYSDLFERQFHSGMAFSPKKLRSIVEQEDWLRDISSEEPDFGEFDDEYSKRNYEDAYGIGAK